MWWKRMTVIAIAFGFAATFGCRETERYVKRHETAQGALIGAGAGAVGGALIGEATTGEAAKGALIGGAVGAAGGALAGHIVEDDKDHGRRWR